MIKTFAQCDDNQRCEHIKCDIICDPPPIPHNQLLDCHQNLTVFIVAHHHHWHHQRVLIICEGPGWRYICTSLPSWGCLAVWLLGAPLSPPGSKCNAMTSSNTCKPTAEHCTMNCVLYTYSLHFCFVMVMVMVMMMMMVMVMVIDLKLLMIII